jgi:hypothetical protein
VHADENTTNMYAERLEESLKQLPCICGETIQEEWDICKSTIQLVAEEVLGRQVPRQKHEWLDKDCERATKEKNVAYLIMQQHGTRNKVLRYQEKREKKVRMGKETARRTSRSILHQRG